MARGTPELLLRAEDKGRWSVILRERNGQEKILPAATPAELLIATSEIDYTEYRKEIQKLRE